MSEKTKTTVLYVIVFLITAALVSRIFYLQIIKGSYYKNLSENKSIRIIEIPTVRGKILDRNGVVLAEDLPSYYLEITRSYLKKPKEELEYISGIIGIPVDKIEEILNNSGIPPYDPVVIKRELSLKQVVAIKEHSFELPGIDISLRAKRFYPYGEIGENFLGFVGLVTKDDLKRDKFYNYNDYIGKQGIEKEYENFLRGEKGKEEVQIDASGKIIKVLSAEEPVPGNNIYLTIDIRLQKKLEELVGDKTGVSIALDPKSGEILAMVSRPSFDPNKLIEGMSEKEYKELSQKNAFFNRATQGEYPSGSTFKPITLIAALMTHTITKNTVIYCKNSIRIGNVTFRDWIYPAAFGYQNPETALANSSDVFFYTIGTKTGISAIDEYAKSLGLGEKTGIDLPGESSGLLPTPEWKKNAVGTEWYIGDTANLSIGQGFLLVTPIQMATLYEGLANNGLEYTPHLLLKITDSSGKVIKTYGKKIRLKEDLPNDVMDVVKNGMEMLANRPEMRIMKIGGRTVCAKTGTAEIGKNSVDHWLIAFSNREDPEIVGLFFFENSDFASSHSLSPLMGKLFETYYEIKKPGGK